MQRKSLTFFIIILTLLVGCKKESQTTPEIPAPTVPVTKAAPIDKAPQSVSEPVSEPEVIDRGVDLNDKYFLVFASYTVEDFALSKKNELIKDGFSPEIFMINEDGWYKLAIESYNTVSKAKDAVIRLQEKYPQLYIITK